MSNEKRFVLCMLLAFAYLLCYPYVLRLFGINPLPRKPPAAVAAQDREKQPEPAQATPQDEARPEAGKAQKPAAADGKAEVAAAPTPKPPTVQLVEPAELVLGSVADKSPGGYRLEVWLDQNGAGVDSVISSRYDAELEGNVARKRPLQLIRHDPLRPRSLSLNLTRSVTAPPPAADQAPVPVPAEAEEPLDSIAWEVVRDDQGRIVHPESRVDEATKAPIQGQSVSFRTRSSDGLVVTKTFRLWQNADGFEVTLRFDSPERERTVVYDLLGPHGIPIEGEWYTGTFRDLVFGQWKGNQVDAVTHSAADIVKASEKPDNTALPLRFAGIENQYFADLVEPDPPPTGENDRLDSRAIAVVLHKDENAPQKADIGVRIISKPFPVGPNQPRVHTYKVFAGPKTPEALRPYGAEVLASYRKNQWIPFAPELARFVITPTLALTYQVTAKLAGLFGGKAGNYGIAIILLTMLVRGLMFPIGRKQALAAQKMQELQPHLKELQEKYKDDKEQLTKETFALYKRHGANPLSGCLPALIQIPIFVGLWQALNTSFPLRHASFLWIRDLAAPDMMFRFPFEVPFLGHWFNLLPFVVIGLMLVQTKLFSPPATNPEQEMQQKMMKYMMIFMGVMFYKVPSGLGIYFITSSLWAIGERLLLPKVAHAHALAGPDLADGELGGEKGPGRREGKGAALLAAPGPRGGNGAPAPRAKPPGRFAQFWERVLEEARKDPTYRKVLDERDGKDREKEKGDPRARPRRR
ncbi:MAG TPA: membrane protein insertase YidC [Isosphaeraceae bacterium]|nr:membrane protein insertase YidC [Isosphaeraceae bacterium]